MITETKTKVIRTRYAPSPTGQLHIGGARTALFNYLLAKSQNGKFVLRIEDTDEDRNIKGSELIQEENLKYLNIFPDESFSNPGSFGPYLQSQKQERYLKLAHSLVEEKKAYFCFCTEKELDESRKTSLANNLPPNYSKKCRNLTKEEIEAKLAQSINYTIRIKTDIKDLYAWKDLIRDKEISFPSSALSDAIIIRSNQKTTYNFAVVIDDYDMQINQILRGEEHISNTPTQIAIYHALGWEKNIPQFGHISMILDTDKLKMSKRSGKDIHLISTFRKKGYPPEALFNFLVLLSWSHEQQEIYSQEEIIKLFNLKNVSASPTIFDIEKLNWLSHKYFQKMDESHYLNFIKPYFLVDLKENNEKKTTFALLNKNRIVCAEELNELASSFFSEKQLTKEHKLIISSNKALIEAALENFPNKAEKWDITTVRNYLKAIMEISNLKGINFFKPIRITFSHEGDGISIYDLLLLLGKEKSYKNLLYTHSLLNEI